MIKAIKSAEDHQQALARIEALMARPGSPEVDDEIEVLGILVEKYEEEHFPIEQPTPVEAIKFRMEQMGLRQIDLVPYLGSRSKVSEVLSGKRSLTLKMIRALSDKLDIPAEILMQDRQTLMLENSNGLEWEAFPIAEMMRKGWIAKVREWRTVAEEICRDLIDSAGGFIAIPAARFRLGGRLTGRDKINHYALMAWCLKLLALARTSTAILPVYAGNIDATFMRKVAKFSYFENGPLIAKEYLAKHGIDLIILSHLTGTHLDGAAMFAATGNPIIGLTLRYDRIDYFWFCLLHELAHVCLHLNPGREALVLDEKLMDHGAHSQESAEIEAHEMAQESLIPIAEWNSHPVHEKPSIENAIDLAKHLEISPAVVAGRIRYETSNYRLLTQLTGQGQIRRLFPDML
ncbi:MAG: ImmA/IrrE family metallo-endopeptidase [Thermodesulfobacteriota bacterium]